MKVYAAEDLRSEIAYLAYHFHWPHNELLALEHIQRIGYIRQVAGIHQRLGEGT
ncbi:DUF6760 family protein [Streptomyces sp. NPDC092307]|uniref:DUF6760 family protein n=1 Tax=Streptomyces sp. NPDC092307 TaxID=3366013 RepID=UPI00381402DC